MNIKLFDAHVHLADAGLKDALPDILSTYETIGLAHAIVVGSAPQDWPNVFELSRRDDRLIPAVGLHPWEVNGAPADWKAQFLAYLDRGVAVIGEIGLDQWIEGHEIERQLDAFTWQLSHAAARDLPTSIHCLKAHEPLLQTLRQVCLPKRGFKLHAYNGPVETMSPLLDLGAYFSFNAGQLKPNAKRIHELIQLVPDNRLLVETDAPNFQPPAKHREFALADPELCHPGNLRAGYQAVAEVRGTSTEELCEIVAENFRRYFPPPESR
ncbi:MAG: TatD family hydrolase [Opitutales bacterium]